MCDELNFKFDRSVSMLAWAYNEEKLVESFLDKAFELLEQNVCDYEVILVNDGSTDSTGAIISAYASKEPRLKVITHDKNLNVGLATRSAIKHASKQYLFWQTLDWSYDLQNFRLFLELLKYFTVVQGIRPAPERILSHIPVIRSIYRVNSRSDNLRKAVVSLSNYYLLRILFGVPFHDFQNITFYPTHIVQDLELQGRSSFVNPELLMKTYYRGASFLEVPIKFIPRTLGEAKGTKIRAIIRSLWDVVSNAFKWGLRLRFRKIQDSNGMLFRVSEPFFIEENVLQMIVPLFKEFR